MRAFGGTFAGLIGDLDFADTFMAVELELSSQTIYVADRAGVTIDGNDYLPLVLAGGFGDVASLFDRQEGQLDINAIELRLSNAPVLPGGVALSALLGQAPEQSFARIWWCAIDSGGGIHRELALLGVFRAPSSWSFESVTIRVFSLQEAFLSAPWGRTIDGFVYNLMTMRPSDDGATLRIPIGDARQVAGIVVVGEMFGPVLPTATNVGDGAYVGAVEMGQGITAYRDVLLFNVVIDFSSSTSFSVTVAGQPAGTGNINDDFFPVNTSPAQGLFKLPGGQWLGTFVAGDQFFFQGRAVFPYPSSGGKQSQVFWAEDLTNLGYPMGGVNHFYWDGKPVRLDGGQMGGLFVYDDLPPGGKFQIMPRLNRPVVAGSLHFRCNFFTAPSAGISIALYRGKLASLEENGRLDDDKQAILYPSEEIDTWAFDIINLGEPNSGLNFLDGTGALGDAGNFLEGTLQFHGAKYLPADWYYLQVSFPVFD